MRLARRTRTATTPRPHTTDRAEPSHTLVALVEPIAPERPSHARRCLHHLPERLGWASPVLDPEQPRDVDCTTAQARELALWLHHRPSHELVLVGCHRRRPA